MKQMLLATALIALPVAAFTAFTAFQVYQAGATVVMDTAAPVASLGDLSVFAATVADVQTIAAGGDLAAAQVRITDFETEWDDAEATLRPLNTNTWGVIDDAADAALKALRATTPEAAKVNATLTALMAALTDPVQTVASEGSATLVSGVAVTDANGRALPCETMLATLRANLTTATLADADTTAVAGFQTKATERCNADDDAHADDFSAQAIALTLK